MATKDNTDTANTVTPLPAKVGALNLNTSAWEIIEGTGERISKNGVSIVVPTNWFLSTELESDELAFAVATERGATSIMSLQNRTGVVMLVFKHAGITPALLPQHIDQQGADFASRMKGAYSHIEQITLGARHTWRWTTDTITTSADNGAYNEAYYFISDNIVVEAAVTSFDSEGVDTHRKAIEQIVTSIE